MDYVDHLPAGNYTGLEVLFAQVTHPIVAEEK